MSHTVASEKKLYDLYNDLSSCQHDQSRSKRRGKGGRKKGQRVMDVESRTLVDVDNDLHDLNRALEKHRVLEKAKYARVNVILGNALERVRLKQEQENNLMEEADQRMINEHERFDFNDPSKKEGLRALKHLLHEKVRRNKKATQYWDMVLFAAMTGHLKKVGLKLKLEEESAAIEAFKHRKNKTRSTILSEQEVLDNQTKRLWFEKRSDYDSRASYSEDYFEWMDQQCLKFYKFKCVVPSRQNVTPQNSQQLLEECRKIRQSLERSPPIFKLYHSLVPPAFYREPKPPTLPPGIKPSDFHKRESSTYGVVGLVPVLEMAEHNARDSFEKYWADLQLNDTIEDERTRRRILEECITRKWLLPMRQLFYYYSLFSMPYNMMILSDFQRCMKECTVLDKTVTPMLVAIMFKRVNIEEEYDDNGNMVLGGDDSDNPNNAFVPAEFFECLVRVAMMKFAHMKTLSPIDCMDKLIKEHLNQHEYMTTLPHTLHFRHRLHEDPVRELVRQYAEPLYKHFHFMSIGNRLNQTNPNPYLLDLMDFQGLSAILSQANCYNKYLTADVLKSATALSREENNIKDPAQIMWPSFIEILCRCASIAEPNCELIGVPVDHRGFGENYFADKKNLPPKYLLKDIEAVINPDAKTLCESIKMFFSENLWC